MPRSIVRSRSRGSSNTSSSHGNHHHHHNNNKSSRDHGGDSSIRRGAAMIRQEITRQFNMQPQQEEQQQQSDSSASDHTDFSEVWLNPYGQKSTLTPPRIAQRSNNNPGTNESLEYSMESSIGTTPEDGRTFASKGDASQWAKGSVLVSPESPPSSPIRATHPVHLFTDNQENYDFIEDDYVEEFELDDYDEVCHPLYTREGKQQSKPPKPVLKRLQTPPVAVATRTRPPSAPKKRERSKTPSPQKTTTETNIAKTSSTVTTSTSSTPPTAVFAERRQGPPSPANSSNNSVASGSQQHSNCEVPSPLQVDYDMILQDPAYRHAQRAGHVWQSLVGHHIRFPSRWWNGNRAPPLGLETDAPWHYLGRFASHDARLRKFCKNRAAPGRLLLHIVMLDLVTCKPLQDVCVGCFHPSARGIRRTQHPNASWEGVRDLWLAVRKRTNDDSVSVMDQHFSMGQPATKSPLGPHQKVTNSNVRAVFGEEPPVETLFVPESYLYELYMAAVKKHNHAVAPPLVLLQEFVFA